MQQLPVVRQRRREQRQRAERQPGGMRVGKRGRLTLYRNGVRVRDPAIVLSAVGRKI